MKIFFSHGKESGPKAQKICAMQALSQKYGVESESIDYRGIELPSERVAKLLSAVTTSKEPCLLVGSSMGAYVSIAASQNLEVEGLFLLAPAVFMPGYEQLNYASACQKIHVIHGWQDEVVPVDNAIRFGRQNSASLHLVKDGHRLSGSIELIEREFEQFLRFFL